MLCVCVCVCVLTADNEAACIHEFLVRMRKHNTARTQALTEDVHPEVVIQVQALELADAICACGCVRGGEQQCGWVLIVLLHACFTNP